MLDRTKIVHEQFLSFVKQYDVEPKPINQDASSLLEIFTAQLQSRLLDYKARALKSTNQSFYTISSAGHEGNAVFGHLLQKYDPCLLHYRSGAFMMARAKRHQYNDMVRDTILSMVASKEDSTSGGRHKVWGSKELWVPPQTSTIASHLPKAVGMAYGISRAERLRVDTDVKKDSIVFVSFGDASCNHASAQTAFNSACWAAYQNLPMPIFFLCEDNGLGISVRTPHGWIEQTYSQRKELAYFSSDGCDVQNTLEQAERAIAYCRVKRKPVFFHMNTVRLFGHAGSDVETSYRKLEEIQDAESLDPLIQTAKTLLDGGVINAKDLLRMIEQVAKQVDQTAHTCLDAPKLSTSDEVVQALSVDSKRSVERVSGKVRRDLFTQAIGFVPEESPKPRHMGMQINWALHELMFAQNNILVFGEDVARKGGVYHVTSGLSKTFGNSRVFNTLLDETMILGLSIGLSQIGFLPIPEIQYLAYYHNAEDQIRGEACSQSFFSNGQFINPMVVRIASFAYQKGFGGHFHNDNSIAALLDVPGVTVMTPSRGDDAALMLQQAVHLATSEGRVVLFLEPIALYMQKDLHQEGDGAWLFPYPHDQALDQPITPRHYHEDATDILIITYANGVHMSLQASEILQKQHGISAHVMDLRMLKPLPWEAILKTVAGFDRILVVDECRAWGGVKDRIISRLAEDPLCARKTFQSIQAHDTYVPLGPAADLVLPQVADIVAQSIKMTR